MDLNLKNKVGIITGAAKGIGYQIAKNMANEGMNLVLVDYDELTLKKTVKELDQYTILSIKADISSENDVNRMVDVTLEKYGNIDILINNAGICWPIVPVKDLKGEDWNKILDIDLKGVYLCSKAVLPTMIKNGYGKIVNISSIFGKRGSPDVSAYSAAKFGVIGFTQSLAQEVGNNNIQVNAVCPGYVVFTDQAKDVIQERANLSGRTYDEVEEELKREISLRRFPHIDEIPYLVSFLISDKSNYITGQSITIDGGIIFH